MQKNKQKQTQDTIKRLFDALPISRGEKALEAIIKASEPKPGRPVQGESRDHTPIDGTTLFRWRKLRSGDRNINWLGKVCRACEHWIRVEEKGNDCS